MVPVDKGPVLVATTVATYQVARHVDTTKIESGIEN